MTALKGMLAVPCPIVVTLEKVSTVFTSLMMMAAGDRGCCFTTTASVLVAPLMKLEYGRDGPCRAVGWGLITVAKVLVPRIEATVAILTVAPKGNDVEGRSVDRTWLGLM